MKFTSAATLFLFVASFATDAVARTNTCKAKKGSNSTVNAHSGGGSSSFKSGHKKAAAGYKSSASAWSSSYAPTSTKSSSSAKSTKGASSGDNNNDDDGSSGGGSGTTSTNNLRTSCNPGGNFDLSKWMLQLPTFDSHGGVQSLQADALTGCGGFKLSNYFYTGSDGAMVMKAPGSNSGCAITGGSEHCRTELGEKSPSSWKPSADTNRLYAKLKGVSGDTVVIGQAFQANSGFMKPIAELNYDSDGSLNMRVATRKEGGGGQDSNPLGKVPHGTVFTYEIRYEKDKLCVSINGASCKNIPLNFDSPGAFFKAGDYNQADDDAEIHFYELTITH